MHNLLQAPLSQTTREKKKKTVVDSCDQANRRGGMSQCQSQGRESKTKHLFHEKHGGGGRREAVPRTNMWKKKFSE